MSNPNPLESGDRTNVEIQSPEPASVAPPSSLSHLNSQGEIRMVDVTDKANTFRQAIAAGRVRMSISTLQTIQTQQGPKGNVVETARIAGIMAAKRTADLIPLCHPLPLSGIQVQITADPDLPGFQIEAKVKTSSQTGVEMEALTAVAVAALTLYDMAKALEKTMVIENVHLVEKLGGKSGSWHSPGGSTV